MVVLRNGLLVAEMDVAEATDERLIREMVGVEHLASVTADRTGPVLPVPVFTASGLTAPGLGPISLSVNQGEVLGVAGLMGAGPEPAAAHDLRRDRPHRRGDDPGGLALRAPLPRRRGRGRRRAGPRGPQAAVDHRHRPGALERHPRHPSAAHPAGVLLAARGEGRGGRIRQGHRGADGVDRAADRIACRAGTSSGSSSANGSRRHRNCCLLDEPTRGVDVGAKAEIYELIDEARARGMAVIVASSELEELFHLSDQIVVLRSGPNRPGAGQRRILERARAAHRSRSEGKPVKTEQAETSSNDAMTRPPAWGRAPPVRGAGRGKLPISPNSGWSPPACWCSSS